MFRVLFVVASCVSLFVVCWLLFVGCCRCCLFVAVIVGCCLLFVVRSLLLCVVFVV